MKERPILFTGEMVRAIFDGRKTQTRRLVKPQPLSECVLTRMQDGFSDGIRPVFGLRDEPNAFSAKSPFGTIEDRLWVRETWGLMAHHDPTDWFRGSIRGMNEDFVAPRYSIEHRANWKLQSDYARWHPSIHMPRWASRIDLEITAVRVERVKNITAEDAKNEGVSLNEYYSLSRHPHRSAFIYLWQSIYGNWDANPWVWVYEFRRIKP